MPFTLLFTSQLCTPCFHFFISSIIIMANLTLLRNSGTNFVSVKDSSFPRFEKLSTAPPVILHQANRIANIMSDMHPLLINYFRPADLITIWSITKTFVTPSFLVQIQLSKGLYGGGNLKLSNATIAEDLPCQTPRVIACRIIISENSNSGNTGLPSFIRHWLQAKPH